jgi:transposase InsO family protein
MKRSRRKTRFSSKNSLYKKFANIYFSTKSPYGLGGKTRFLKGVKRRLGNTKSVLEKAKGWLAGVDTYTLHRPVVTGKTKRRRRTVVTGIDSTWQADLADLPQFMAYNDGARYVLFVIDVFSRFAWTRSLKNKDGESIAKAMTDIMQTSGRSPQYIQTDLGKEFKNK